MISHCLNEACPAREYGLSLKTAQLETDYEKSVALLGSLVAQEESRRSRVDCVILEADHEVLQTRCERSKYDFEQLLQAETTLKQQLLQAQDDLATLQLSTRTDWRAMEDLKNDVISMRRKVSDNEKLSAENLSLTKEISHMKQEFERLQSQNKSHQTLIAEKSALERQLNSLEVQLEEERRAYERHRNSENKNQNAEAQQQLKKLQEELRKEVDERRRVEQETHEKSIAWEEQKKSLEERLQMVRKQLRSTKDKLKEHQSELRISQGLPKSDTSRQSVASDRSTSLGYAGATFDPAMTIATPGAVKITKKGQKPSANLGEKSVFSITPYLRRNRSAESSSSSSDDDLHVKAKPRQAGKRPRVSPRSDGVERSGRNHESLNRGRADEDSDNEEAHEALNAEDSVLSTRNEGMQSIVSGTTAKRDSSLDGKQNQRKRKVLGGQRDMTFLDEEDEQLEERPRKVERLIPSLKPGSKRPQAVSLSRRAFGETSTFSPLKRAEIRRTSAAKLDQLPTSRYTPRSCLHRVYLLPNPIIFRWQSRQRSDIFTREAVVKGLKSRAAFKLLQIDEQYRVFRGGQTVVDLGYAPGSWSQVAVTRTQPNGRVLGVDIIPAQPPKGVSTIQGNFLSPDVQQYVLEFVRDPNRGRPRRPAPSDGNSTDVTGRIVGESESILSQVSSERGSTGGIIEGKKDGNTQVERTVDVVLSDMSAPWVQVRGFSNRSLSNPYRRMMNTSGINFRDHAGSMDLCRAALQFSFNVLKTGGHFVCKFYQGPEDKILEKQLKALFDKVHRLKPESSRSV
ncbi:hypothetical protein UA08_09116 [Talaromyces atroroseus]|uniref:rRNA methyltransferase 2, mitochondrial n=1 Tax=Talaromyces atroroseus TaxID=1441469 RepID=A0A1Q5Q7A9_TALAT|nr:hypothetical protein UA08_09116 [Talaromyces atroroseus]OKL55738.1 hypothetical protein UA08_09116 [Talaromyces atroroseus]